MGRDEARLREHRKDRLEPALARYAGRLVKLTGGGALIEFASAVDALSWRSKSRRPWQLRTRRALRLNISFSPIRPRPRRRCPLVLRVLGRLPREGRRHLLERPASEK